MVLLTVGIGAKKAAEIVESITIVSSHVLAPGASLRQERVVRQRGQVSWIHRSADIIEGVAMVVSPAA